MEAVPSGWPALRTWRAFPLTHRLRPWIRAGLPPPGTPSPAFGGLSRSGRVLFFLKTVEEKKLNTPGHRFRGSNPPPAGRLSDYGYLWVHFVQFATVFTWTPSSDAIAA